MKCSIKHYPLVLACLASFACDGPDKKVETKTLKKDAVTIHSLADKPGKDAQVDGLVEAIGYNANSAKGIDGFKKLIKNQEAQIFYYYGHSSTASTNSEGHWDALASPDWSGFYIDHVTYRPADFDSPKAPYMFIMMNCCWSSNGPAMIAWRDKLHPKVDAGGKPVKTKCLYLGWPGGVGIDGAADFAIRFFKKAKAGNTTTTCWSEAHEESVKEFDILWHDKLNYFKAPLPDDPTYSLELKLYGGEGQ